MCVRVCVLVLVIGIIVNAWLIGHYGSQRHEAKMLGDRINIRVCASRTSGSPKWPIKGLGFN